QSRLRATQGASDDFPVPGLPSRSNGRPVTSAMWIESLRASSATYTAPSRLSGSSSTWRPAEALASSSFTTILYASSFSCVFWVFGRAITTLLARYAKGLARLADSQIGGELRVLVQRWIDRRDGRPGATQGRRVDAGQAGREHQRHLGVLPE